MSRVNKIEKIETPAEVDEKEITKQVEIIKENTVETVEKPKKKGRGRPRKNISTVEDNKEEKQENKTESKPKLKPEPKSESKLEQKSKPKSELKPKPKPKPMSMPKPKENSKIKIEPELETEEFEEVEKEEVSVKEKTINLKDIKKTLKNKVDTTQKKSLIKELLIYFGMAVLMVFHLFVLYMGTKNIELNILINDMKIITLCILALGIGTLEFSYKKDEFRIALRGLEVLVFGASNLCLVYVAKLYFTEVPNFLKYIGIVIIAYYIVKIILTAIFSIRKYKKDNNDIKDIVKK